MLKIGLDGPNSYALVESYTGLSRIREIYGYRIISAEMFNRPQLVRRERQAIGLPNVRKRWDSLAAKEVD